MPATRINEFFRQVGLPLSHPRQAWGAANDQVVLLKAWSDDWRPDKGEVQVLRATGGHRDVKRYGLKERLAHLDSLWSKKLAGYTVIADPASAKSGTRSSKPLRSSNIYPIRRLRHDGSGVITAVLGTVLMAEGMWQHAETHRTRSGRGALPLDPELQQVLDEYLRRKGHAAGRGTKNLKARESRFIKAQVRPEQQAFRLAVFRAYGGKCPLSQCLVPEAVEAAHLHGRDWRKGHNDAADGILLRRDLHALYDRDLLRIDASGAVKVSPLIAHEYGWLSVVVVTFEA